eukprot:TRINITY_DN32998_c0_g1_i1.p1 TRINITY_DN32998_c0_g1~~TRINITY_DN32998_c0_g1_i1.p1  ORF type:complete len:487 (+),score=99.33 TRINITY_DN32998_c0_g1_i1:534-1994(+)
MKKTNTGGVAAEFAKKAGIVAKESTFKERTWVHTSRTLYVTNVAPGTQTDELEGLFRDLEGFIAFRRVRSMGFVDFQEKQQATVAMWKTNGHKFRPHHDGLLVSYDKDDSEERGGWSMRTREEEKRRRMEADATRVMYRCSACSHFCFKLARPITDMPERKTDKSRVVDTGKDLVYLVCVKGGTKLLKREKGIEKQFRYNCELCDICVAYRPVPYEQESKFIYVFPEAVVSSTGRSTAHTSLNSALPSRARPGGAALPSRSVEKIAIGDPTEGDGLLGPSLSAEPAETSLPDNPGSIQEAPSEMPVAEGGGAASDRNAAETSTPSNSTRPDPSLPVPPLDSPTRPPRRGAESGQMDGAEQTLTTNAFREASGGAMDLSQPQSASPPAGVKASNSSSSSHSAPALSSLASGTVEESRREGEGNGTEAMLLSTQTRESGKSSDGNIVTLKRDASSICVGPARMVGGGEEGVQKTLQSATEGDGGAKGS